MATIRQYARSIGFKVVGKLTRHPELEITTDPATGKQRQGSDLCYQDQGGNTYWITDIGIRIERVEEQASQKANNHSSKKQEEA